MNSNVRFLLAAMIAVMSAGCMRYGTGIDSPPSGKEPRLRVPEYGWGFCNLTGPELSDVRLIWSDKIGSLAAGAGILAVGGGAEDNEGWDPLPAKGTVYWRIASFPNPKKNPLQSQDVEIASTIPDLKHFTGTIWLVYRDGKPWTVEPISKDEALRRMKAGKPDRPDQ